MLPGLKWQIMIFPTGKHIIQNMGKNHDLSWSKINKKLIVYDFGDEYLYSFLIKIYLKTLTNFRVQTHTL